MIDKQVGAGNVALVVIEPILGEGGFVVPADGFLPRLAEWCNDNSVVFVADEIETGFCRTGSWFACRTTRCRAGHDHRPRGSPAVCRSRVTGRAEIMDSVKAGGLGGTYGGNPVACAAAIGSITTMRDLDLAGRARHIGELMTDRLTEMQTSYPIIGDVRGRGAMLAIELVEPDHDAECRSDGSRQRGMPCARCADMTCGTFGTSSSSTSAGDRGPSDRGSADRVGQGVG